MILSFLQHMLHCPGHKKTPQDKLLNSLKDELPRVTTFIHRQLTLPASAGFLHPAAKPCAVTRTGRRSLCLLLRQQPDCMLSSGIHSVRGSGMYSSPVVHAPLTCRPLSVCPAEAYFFPSKPLLMPLYGAKPALSSILFTLPVPARLPPHARTGRRRMCRGPRSHFP